MQVPLCGRPEGKARRAGARQDCDVQTSKDHHRTVRGRTRVTGQTRRRARVNDDGERPSILWGRAQSGHHVRRSTVPGGMDVQFGGPNILQHFARTDAYEGEQAEAVVPLTIRNRKPSVLLLDLKVVAKAQFVGVIVAAHVVLVGLLGRIIVVGRGRLLLDIVGVAGAGAL